MKTKMSVALLTLLIAAGCSENDQINLPEAPVNAVPINLGQQVKAVSRAVAADGVNVSATLLMCDGSGSEADWSKFVKVEKNAIDESNQLTSRASISAASFTVAATPANDISLNQLLYYSLSDGVKSFIAAVSPAGKVADSGASVNFNQEDGTQDVMWASTVSVGSAKDETNAGGTAKYNLAFTHKTTQLNFAVALTRVQGGGEWQNKKVALKSIAVQKASVPQAINVANGDITWSTPVTFKVPGISEAAIAATATEVGEAFMINPYTEVILDVVITVDGAEKIFNNVRVTTDGEDAGAKIDLAREEGKSHKITLTIQEPANADTAVTIKTTATVKPWQQGASGSADL